MVAELTRLVDSDTGLLSRRIYQDEDIYQQELENVFARCWSFLCHESQIPNPATSSPPTSAKTRSWSGGTRRARWALS